MSLYSFRIENGVVVDATVSSPDCSAEWLMNVKGGLWVDSETLVGIGWLWNEVDGFSPPTVPDIPQE